MSRWFDEALDRIKKATGVRTQVELAELLGIRQSSISDAKKRNSIPSDWFIKLYRSHGLNPDWLSYGTEPVYLKAGKHDAAAFAEAAAPYGQSITRSRSIQVFGMTDIEGPNGDPRFEPLGEISIPESFYRPSLMALRVDVTSMEPFIRKGAYVGIDRDSRKIQSGEVYGVLVPLEGLTLRRPYLDLENERIILRSDNPKHQEQSLPIDNLEKQILGKVIWVLQEI